MSRKELIDEVTEERARRHATNEALLQIEKQAREWLACGPLQAAQLIEKLAKAQVRS